MKTNVIEKRDSSLPMPVDTNSVHLIITSPPYFNAIEYDVHNKTGDAEDYRVGHYFKSMKEYKTILFQTFVECNRVLNEGRYTAVVVGDFSSGKRVYSLPALIYAIALKAGFEYRGKIIWHKMTGGVRRAGVAIKYPFPSYFYANIMTEDIMLFSKKGKKWRNKRSKFKINEVFTQELANNVWHIAPVPPNANGGHPCPFPEEIPYRLIKLHSASGELVLDPFNGIGTTTKVANCLRRQFIGYDVYESYNEIARKKLGESLNLRKPSIAKFVKIGVEW